MFAHVLTLCVTVFAVLLKYTYASTSDTKGINLQRHKIERNVLQLFQAQEKAKAPDKVLRHLLFADDSTVFLLYRRSSVVLDSSPALTTWICFAVASFSNPRPRFVPSQLVCPPPIWIFLKNVMFILHIEAFGILFKNRFEFL